MHVDLYEKNTELLVSASMNNQNRLHLGYHYPRDLDTAIQCRESFDLFFQKYREAVKDNFDNFYFIEKNESKVNLKEFKKFCDTAKLPFNKIELNELPFKINNIEGCIKVNESIYDSDSLRKLVKKNLSMSDVNIKYSTQIKNIKQLDSKFLVIDSSGNKTKYDIVINASYENFNAYRDGLGIPKRKLKFQQTFIPIIEINNFNSGITIMDGPFITILPFGKTGKFLLYDVVNSVISSKNGYEYQFSKLNHYELQSTKSLLDARQKIFAKLRDFLPKLDFKDTNKSLFGPRAILAGVEDTDRRVSMIDKQFNNTYFDVIAGKVDQSMLVSLDICDTLNLIN